MGPNTDLTNSAQLSIAIVGLSPRILVVDFGVAPSGAHRSNVISSVGPLLSACPLGSSTSNPQYGQATIVLILLRLLLLLLLAPPLPVPPLAWDEEVRFNYFYCYSCVVSNITF
jgi:hypothetical protein